MALDRDGLHEDRPNAITTWTGKRVEPLAMRREDFDIKDIAHALARLCRYNGHVEGYYSVARHSILVSEMLEGTGYELAGLLHDAAEAYLGDLVRPLKASEALTAFREADKRLDEAVADRYGLPWPQPAAVTEADRVLLTEFELPRPNGLRWTHTSTIEDDEIDFLRRYYLLVGDPESYFELPAPAPKPPLLVGLSGYAQSGKDTAARVLTEFFSFQRVAFADALREFALALNPKVWDKSRMLYTDLSRLIEEIGWERAKTENPQVRELLQRLGTEAGRKVVGENVWVDTAMRKVTAGRYVFTDVRFPNEFDAIKAAGGVMWRIARPGTSAVNMHPSETALDLHTFDLTIHNDGSVQELDRKVHSAAARLFLKR